MKTTAPALLASLLMLNLPINAEVKSTVPVEESPKSDFQFDLDVTSLHSDDESDFTAALAYDLKWTFLHDRLPWESTTARLEAQGALAIDDELNREPLLTEVDFLWSALILEDWASQHTTRFPGRDVEMPTFEMGLTARYETDQRLDHRNGVGSAFLAFTHDNPYRWLAIMPSVLVSLDGVVTDESTTAASLNADNPDHARFRAEATWRFGLSNLSDLPLLRASMISAHLQYTKDFGMPDEIEQAGLDESFGAAVEYAWMFDTGVRDNAPYGAPKYFFIRATFGRVAPEPENDTSILVGFRIGIEDVELFR